MKRVLVLQHAWDDSLGYLGQILREQKIEYDIVDVPAAPIPNITKYDALIALGGPQQAYADEKYPYFVQEKAVLRSAVEQDIPFLGICLGAQLLASALGAPVMRNSFTKVGFFQVQITDEGKADPLFERMSDKQQVFHWHEDVFAIPEGGSRLATACATPNQAFRIGQRAYGLQYHIELTSTMLDTWFHHPDFRKKIVKIVGEDGLERIAQQQSLCYTLYQQQARTLFENFLKLSDCIS